MIMITTVTIIILFICYPKLFIFQNFILFIITINVKIIIFSTIIDVSTQVLFV